MLELSLQTHFPVLIHLHKRVLASGCGEVSLLFVLAHKNSDAPTELPWQNFFGEVLVPLKLLMAGSVNHMGFCFPLRVDGQSPK